MSGRPFDVAILGAGFGGSLLAVILRRLGRSVVLLDRQVHPRFAIGESSTPVADFVLERICEQFDLSRIRPLARYGAWKSTYPEISRGLKRGFSYFHHRPGQPFSSDREHLNELLVAASETDEAADTHWYRADVDQFFAREAVREGAVLEEGVEATVEPSAAGWRIQALRGGKTIGALEASFLVDGTGGGVLTRILKLADCTHELQTNSRTVFSHVRGLHRWQDLLQKWGFDTADHPYPCDDAALHHIVDGGWMWVLPFENGITSVGFAMDVRRHPPRDECSPADEFHNWLSEYPSIAEQFTATRISETFPSRAPLRTGRIQRLWSAAAGDNWCLLPSTAGFIDPFYSTGIAHSLCGLLRLSRVFEAWRDPAERERRLADYNRAVLAEVRHIDRIVAASYASMGRDPEFLHAASALYFAGATTFERRFPDFQEPPAYLLAEDRDFQQMVRVASGRIVAAAAATEPAESWFPEVVRLIEPFNQVGLLQPEVRHMYRYTAAK